MLVIERRSAPCFPDNLLCAASHPDPYPYYAALLAYRPFYRETQLGMWVALGAGAVRAVLDSPHCRVRPITEPVPANIAGSSAGRVFGNLVRMTDGGRHDTLRAAVTACIGAFEHERLAALAHSTAVACLGETGSSSAGINRFLHVYPVQVIAQQIGLPRAAASEAVVLIGDFVRCLSPLSDSAGIERSKAAASALLDLLERHAADDRHGALPALVARLADLGIAQRITALANLLGLMSQTYEATAGLIGNTLLALARDAQLCRRAAGDDTLLHRVITEVARHDPPIHNTRRFVAEDCLLAGQALKAGDTILTVLAAANRDPAVNPLPHNFDAERGCITCFTFGHGSHACPGASIAVALATVGVQALLAHELNLAQASVSYAPSVNARIPVFGARS